MTTAQVRPSGLVGAISTEMVQRFAFLRKHMFRCTGRPNGMTAGDSGPWLVGTTWRARSRARVFEIGQCPSALPEWAASNGGYVLVP
jgi:hypothetical protein